MEERKITITLEKAREWYNSDNISLKEIALQAFSKEELMCNFRSITTLQNACETLNLNYGEILHIRMNIATVSKASAAMFELNIIRKALNLGYNLHLTKDPKNSYMYYPDNPFISKSSTYYKSELELGKMEVIGEIKSEGKEYYVLYNNANVSHNEGLGFFNSDLGVGFSYSFSAFLNCATKEIAQHFGKYFGMLITEAKYGDIVDFEIINNKYNS